MHQEIEDDILAYVCVLNILETLKVTSPERSLQECHATTATFHEIKVGTTECE